MGDLDSFFAKKDKKKKPGKGFSKANAEIIAKNLEELEKKEQKLQEKEKQDAYLAEGLEEILSKDQDDDEWAEYREKVKDYSVLKVEMVRLADVNDEPEEQQADQKGQSQGASEEKRGWTPSPSTMKKASFSQEVEDKEDEEDDISKEDSSNHLKAAYIPPHLRGSTSPRDMVGVRKSPNRRLKAAPDISSEIYFPSLTAAVEDKSPQGAWGKKLAM